MFKFEPVSEEELVKSRLLSEGEYNFTVIGAEEKISKASGSPMIELKLNVFSNDGRTFFMYDYLVNTPNMMYKIKHFLDSIGLSNKYNSGSFDAYELIGKSGVCKIGIREDKTGQYAPKNIIKEYVKQSKIVQYSQSMGADKTDFGDDSFDDIKF